MARKSLGTLTLDLIAKVSGFEQGMDKAARKSQKTAKQIERYSSQTGAALTAGTAAAVTGMAALVASTANGAREIKNLSSLAGATPQQFQKLTYAAKRYGIEQDKVADILKDTNDRIGDFIQTGGGPMADFFENIAPKVGVTADEFARLSGPRALQLYVDSLQKAGVSQKDMTFYMEAIASDATALIPLLRDGGKEMKVLGDEAERTGYVLSDMDFEQLESVRRGLDELSGAATGMKNQVVMAAIPAINDLIDLLSDEDTLKSAQALGTAVVTAMNKTVQAVDGAIKITRFLAEELAAITAGAAADDLVRLQDQLKTLQSMQENPTERLRFFGKDGIVEFYDESEIAAEIKKTEALIEQAKAQLQTKASEGPNVGLVDAPTAPSVSGRGTGLSKSDQDLQGQLQERLGTIRQAFETEKQTVLRTFKERNDEISALEAESILSSMEAANLRYQNEVQAAEQLKELRDEQLEAQKGYWDKWLESANDNLQNFDELSKTVIDNFTTGFGNAFESVIFDAESLDDALKGIGETILRSVVNAIGQMAAQWLALQAVQAIVGSSATAATVGQAAVASAAWSTPAALASLATAGTNAAPASAAIISTTSLAKGLSLTGMAHDGIDRVPREGTWLLDGGERVMTSPQADRLDQFLAAQGGGAGGSAPIINVNEAPGRGGEIRSRTNQDGQFVIDIMVEQFNSHGPGSKAAQSAFGLKRQGY